MMSTLALSSGSATASARKNSTLGSFLRAISSMPSDGSIPQILRIGTFRLSEALCQCKIMSPVPLATSAMTSSLCPSACKAKRQAFLRHETSSPMLKTRFAVS